MSDEVGAAREEGPFQALLLQIPGEIPGIVWSTDGELRFTSCWGAGLADLSLRPNQVVGMTLFEYFGTDDPEFRAIAAHRRALEGETVAWEQDWQCRAYQTRVAPLRDHEGRIAGCTGIAQDVTAQRRAEETLRETEERYSLAIAAGRTVVWDWDLQANAVVFDRAARASPPYRDQESPFHADRLIERVHPDDRDRVLAEVRAHLDGRKPEFRVECRVPGDDGRVRWEVVRGTAVRDAAGKPCHMVGTVVDITDLKRAEQALQESEERARALLNAPADAMFLIDASGRVIEANETWARALNRPARELVGTCVFDQFPPDVAKLKREQIAEVVRNGRPVQGEDEYEGRIIASTVYPVCDGARKVIQIAVSARDITERKRTEEALRQSEARARALLEVPLDAMYLLDADGTIVDANEAGAQRLNCSVDQLVGTCVFDRLPSDVAQRRRKKAEKVACTGRPLRFEDERDGRVLDSTLYPVFDGEGNVIQVAVSARDVTETRRAQEKLRESERRYRAIVEDQSDFICRFRPDGTITFVNGAVCRLLGKSPQELIGADFVPYVHPDDREDVQRRLAALTPESPLESHENRSILHGGDVCYGHWVNRGIFGPDGNLIEIQSVGRDVTDRVRAEQSLHESQQRYHAIFEQAADSILLVDPDTGAFVEFNDRAHQSLGYTREEFERLTIADFEVVESAEEVASHLSKVLREGSDSFETKQRAKAGEIRDIQVNTKAISVCGRKVVQSIWRDVTDRVRAEEALQRAHEALKRAHEELEERVQARTAALQVANRQLRQEIAERERAERQLRLLSSAVAQSKEGVAVSDLDGRLLFVNESFAAMHGYRAEQVLGEHLSIFHLPEQMPAVEAALREMLETGEFHGEIRHARRDGTVFPALMHNSLLRDEAGQPTGMIGTMRDISDRKRAEEALRESEKRRMGAEKLAATGRLAARVAHEINNPLAGIANCFRLVKAAVPPDHRHYKFTEIIEKEIDRIGRIVRQMFQVHRPDQETVRDVRVAETIGEVVAILEPNCRERRVRVETHADPAEMTIRIPEGSLRQILYNLLANAIEASPPDGVVRVAASAAEADDTVRITVADQGGGIPQAVQDHLFEPFFTTKESDTSGGLGLGLPICKGIVDSLRGSLDFQTKPGGGTTFRVVLPSATN